MVKGFSSPRTFTDGRETYSRHIYSVCVLALHSFGAWNNTYFNLIGPLHELDLETRSSTMVLLAYDMMRSNHVPCTDCHVQRAGNMPTRV